MVITRAWAALLALAVVGGLLVVLHLLTRARLLEDERPAHLIRRRCGVKSLVIGTDGRASTSKVQALLWTLAVLYAFVFLLLWGRSTGCGDGGDGCEAATQARATLGRVVESELQPEYYVLMGLPLAAAVAARAITTAKVADGVVDKPVVAEDSTGVVQGLSEVVSNDRGELDLIDMQYFAFNLLTLSWFFFEFLTRPSAGLPDLPATLVALSGVSVGVYTARKALERT
jgi:hypothetical protein